MLTLYKKLKVRKDGDIYKARPFWNVSFEMQKDFTGQWMANVMVDGAEHVLTGYRSRETLLSEINEFGNDELTTRNILNPEAGDIPILRRDKGGVCDPGTERYHCM